MPLSQLEKPERELHEAAGAVLAVHGTLIKQMAKDLGELRIVVIEGNGEPAIRAQVRHITPLLERLGEMENDLHGVKNWVDEQRIGEEVAREQAAEWRDRIAKKAFDFIWKVALGGALFYLGLDAFPFISL